MLHYTDHKETHTSQHIVSSVMSMYGWAKHGNSYHLVDTYLLSHETLKETVARCCEELQTTNPLLARDYYPTPPIKKK